MRDKTVRHLFVYGTLRHNSGHERAKWLGTIAKFKGAARLAGRLVDLGDYPGLLPPTNALQKVRGDLWELPADAAVLEALDRYEGCHVDDPEPHQYRRILCTATDGEGLRIPCWAYLFQWPAQHRRIIPDGDWLCRD